MKVKKTVKNPNKTFRLELKIVISCLLWRHRNSVDDRNLKERGRDCSV